MITVYRICHQQFIGDTSGLGAKKYGGRWNPEGVACLYCSERLSLAVLEKLVHAQGKTDLVNLGTVSFGIPASTPLYTIDVKKMQPDWRNDIGYTQWMGQQILANSSYAGFIVPSIIIEQEYNIVLNPLSELFGAIEISPVETFEIDKRLIAGTH
ncbi:MAG TPA: RES family NAD+ phosphorylase [Phnomibacter sp.]|nr:RES family NAD+ phosphorylase [Phnomibacter sp.]